jgi:hypothetical protein
VYGDVLWTAVQMLAENMHKELITLRDTVPWLRTIEPGSQLEAVLVLPVVRRAVHNFIRVHDRQIAAAHDRRVQASARAMEAIMLGIE